MGRGSAAASARYKAHELDEAALAGALPIAARMSGSFFWLFRHSLFLDSVIALPVGRVPDQSTKAAQ
eukprot:2032810-Lingulodinium_polyedra.AAC.1